VRTRRRIAIRERAKSALECRDRVVDADQLVELRIRQMNHEICLS
jgi:hypothetical protein